MSEYDSYIHRFLDNFVKDTQKDEGFRKNRLQLREFKNFFRFDKGDRVSMILSSIAINGIYIEETQRVEGILVDPALALIDVKLTDSLEEWEGKTIGLGVCLELQKSRVVKAFSRIIAGDGQVCYFLPEDVEPNSRGKIPVNDDTLRHLPLKYTKVTVGGADIIDFTNAD